MSDSREQLEADAANELFGFIYERGTKDAETMIIGWLDRQAAITRAECESNEKQAFCEKDAADDALANYAMTLDACKKELDAWKNGNIERTCHLSDRHPAHSFDGTARDCLECGYEFDCDCGEDIRFPYCPGCGGKVLDNGR